ITMTSMVYKLGERFGVPVYETPVGFKYLGPVMRKEDALAAGEESGGYAFHGHIPERDGILSGLFILDMMARTGKRPSELVQRLFSLVGEHHFDRWDVPFDPSKRSAVVQRVAARTPATLGGKRVLGRDETDGTRFRLEDGHWLLIRFSGTEPLLRLYAEAASPDQVKRQLTEARDLAGV
ncbi:MAG: phosphoglucomutase/phosphomannomutase family protein, partial [Chloroflexi bacterium]|nr:phosphoglucomutase/phosphomannomutase family protein [Chloroflexota bacterium]